MDYNHQAPYAHHPTPFVPHWPQHQQLQQPGWIPRHGPVVRSHYTEAPMHHKLYPAYGHDPRIPSGHRCPDSSWNQSAPQGVFPNPHLQDSGERTAHQQLQEWNRQKLESHWKQMPVIAPYTKPDMANMGQYPDMSMSKSHLRQSPENYHPVINIVPLPKDIAYDVGNNVRGMAPVPRYSNHEQANSLHIPGIPYTTRPDSVHIGRCHEYTAPPHDAFRQAIAHEMGGPLMSMKRMPVPRTSPPYSHVVTIPDDDDQADPKEKRFPIASATDKHSRLGQQPPLPPLPPPLAYKADVRTHRNVDHQPRHFVAYPEGKTCSPPKTVDSSCQPPRFMMPSYLTNFFRLAAQITRYYHSFIQYGRTPVDSIPISFGDGITVTLSESSLSDIGPERHLVCQIAHLYRKVHPYLPQLFFGQSNQRQALKFCVWYEDEAAGLSISKGETSAQTKIQRLAFLKMVLVELDTYCLNMGPIDKLEQVSDHHRKHNSPGTWPMKPPFPYSRAEYEKAVSSINTRHVNDQDRSHQQQAVSHGASARNNMAVWPENHPSQINIHTVVRIQPSDKPEAVPKAQHTSSPDTEHWNLHKRWGRSQSDHSLKPQGFSQERTGVKRQRRESHPCRPPSDDQAKLEKRIKLDTDDADVHLDKTNVKQTPQEVNNASDEEPLSMPTMEDFLNLSFMQEQLEKEAKDTIKKCMGSFDILPSETKTTAEAPWAVDLTLSEHTDDEHHVLDEERKSKYDKKDDNRNEECKYENNKEDKSGDSDLTINNTPQPNKEDTLLIVEEDSPKSPGSLVIDLSDKGQNEEGSKVECLDDADEKEVKGLVASLGLLPETARLLIRQRRVKKGVRRLKNASESGPIDLSVQTDKGCNQLPVQQFTKVSDTEKKRNISTASVQDKPSAGLEKEALDLSKPYECPAKTLVDFEAPKTV